MLEHNKPITDLTLGELTSYISHLYNATVEDKTSPQRLESARFLAGLIEDAEAEEDKREDESNVISLDEWKRRKNLSANHADDEQKKPLCLVEEWMNLSPEDKEKHRDYYESLGVNLPKHDFCLDSFLKVRGEDRFVNPLTLIEAAHHDIVNMLKGVSARPSCTEGGESVCCQHRCPEMREDFTLNENAVKEGSSLADLTEEPLYVGAVIVAETSGGKGPTILIRTDVFPDDVSWVDRWGNRYCWDDITEAVWATPEECKSGKVDPGFTLNENSCQEQG